jgi:hypothetical protein
MKTIRTITQNEITGIIDYLAHSIQRKSTPAFRPTLMVTIAKGGYIPARLLAKTLGINKILSYGVNFYDSDNKKMKLPYIYQDLIACKSTLQMHDILIVDDISDTGSSLNSCFEHIISLDVHPNRIRTCALFYKESTIHIPHYYFDVVPNDVWIHYPWE